MWNRPNDGNGGGAPSVGRAGARISSPTWRGLYVFGGIAAAVAGATVAWFAFFGGEAASKTPGRKPTRSTIREVKPAAAPKAEPVQAKAPEKPKRHEYGDLVRAVTNASGAVTEDYVGDDGKRRRVVRPPRQVWFNAVDQMIAMALSIREGETAAPFPTGVTDEDFRKALNEKIVIYNDDSEELKDLKRRVRETKKEIQAMMEKEGRSFYEIIAEHREQMNADTETRNQALLGLAEVRKNGTAEDVRKYLVVMNAALQQAGVKELPCDLQNKGRPSERKESQK